jgi:CBS domain-containing protein
MTIGERCTRRVVTARGDETAAVAAARMAEEHVGTLVVTVQRGQASWPAGVVTDRDLVRKVMARRLPPDGVRLDEIMSRDPVLANASDHLSVAFELARTHGVRRFPVVDRDGYLVGILAIDDLIGALGDELAAVAEAIEQGRRRERGARPADPAGATP